MGLTEKNGITECNQIPDFHGWDQLLCLWGLQKKIIKKESGREEKERVKVTYPYVSTYNGLDSFWANENYFETKMFMPHSWTSVLVHPNPEVPHYSHSPKSQYTLYEDFKLRIPFVSWHSMWSGDADATISSCVTVHNMPPNSQDSY